MESLFKITWVGVLIAVIAVVILIDLGEAKKGKHKDAREEEAQALQGDIENGVSPSFIMPRLLDLLHRVSRAGNCPECRTKKGCWGSGGKCQKSTTYCNGTTVDVGCPGDDCECCIPYSSNTLHSKFCKIRRSCHRLNGWCMANCEDCISPNYTRIYSACKGNCFCCVPSIPRFKPIPSPTTLTTFSPKSSEATTGGIASSCLGIIGCSSPDRSSPGPEPSSSFGPTLSSSSSSIHTTPNPGPTTTRAATPNPSTSFTSSSLSGNPPTIPTASGSSPTTPAETTTLQPMTTTPQPTTTTPQPTTTTTKPTTTTTTRCAPDFFPLGDECFQVKEEEESWGNAEQLCRRLGSKHVYLAEPKNSSALAQYMYDNGYTQEHHYWMGGRGDGRNIIWRKTGQPISPSEPWQDGQPSEVTRNYCLDLRIDFNTIPLGLVRPLAVHTCTLAKNHCYICESSLRL